MAKCSWHMCSATGKAEVRFKWRPTAKTGDCLHNVPFQVVLFPAPYQLERHSVLETPANSYKKTMQMHGSHGQMLPIFYIRRIIFKQSYFSVEPLLPVPCFYPSPSATHNWGTKKRQLAKVGSCKACQQPTVWFSASLGCQPPCNTNGMFSSFCDTSLTAS